MAHFIIVEGPDGAGKTTLVNQIAAAYMDCTVVHFGAPANDSEADNYWKKYYKAIMKAAERKDRKDCNSYAVIFDRSWISDMVYGPVMRGREEMPEQMANMLSALVKANGGGMIIYCKSKVRTMWRRCCKRGETYITSEATLKAIADKYEEVMATQSILPVITHNT